VIFEDEKLIGYCGIKKMDNGVNSLFYQFKQDQWGKGYATEVSKKLLAVPF